MLIVARYLDGRIIKGRTTDFHPESDAFHVAIDDAGPPLVCSTKGMKALFFVHSLEGDPRYRDQRAFPEKNGQVRPRVWIRFRDGERMAAFPVSPGLAGKGFYAVPTDRNSNVEKVYIFRASIEELLEGEHAEMAAHAEAQKNRGVAF